MDPSADKIFIAAVLTIAVLAIIGMALDQVTCKEGHVETERQAKGNFHHFVCDKR